MTNAIAWDEVVPVFTEKLRGPKLPAKPSDGAILMAAKSYAGIEKDGKIVHVLRHRFATVEEAAYAADELKRAGSYTTPDLTTVTTVIDPDGNGDKRLLAWSAGERRGRK